jgi:hypothetical protein
MAREADSVPSERERRRPAETRKESELKGPRAERPRARRESMGHGSGSARATRPGATVTENSIRPARRTGRMRGGAEAVPPHRGHESSEQAAAPPDGRARTAHRKTEARRESPEAARAVPDHVRERFVQVGKHYYFSDGARAFTDRGMRLTTASENTEVIKSLVSIAEARGWQEISVRGTERFRKEAWFAARLAGLEVRGYRPSAFEQEHLIRTLAREQGKRRSETAEPLTGTTASRASPAPERTQSSTEGQRDPERRDRLFHGKLLDHGRATYQHDPRAPMSYFVKIETSHGDRTIWGVDLERAFKESLTRPQVGDEIALRTVRQDAVKVKTAERNSEGKVIGEKSRETHRNQWIVEKRSFFEARAQAARTLRDTAIDPKQAVRRHPELVGTYLQVHAAELAAKQFRDPFDQRRFVTQVRTALADAVARGEPLPPVRLRESAPERAPARSRASREHERAPVRE